MKEIMNEWRSYLEQESLNEIGAVGAMINLGRKNTTIAAVAGTQGLGFVAGRVVDSVPQVGQILKKIEQELIKQGMPKNIIFPGIEKILSFFFDKGMESVIKTKPIQDAILRFFYVLSRNIPWLLRILPRLIKGVPIVSLALDLKEIYDQIQIVIQEIERASTAAAEDSESKNTSLALIRQYEEQIKTQGYTKVFGLLQKIQRDRLNKAFNVAKKQIPNIVDFNPNAYKLISDFDEQQSYEYKEQHGFPLPEN